MNLLGIDPSSTSVGLCYIAGSVIRFARVSKSSSQKLSDVQRDIGLITRVRTAIYDLVRGDYIHFAVLEEPKDAQPHWAKGGPMGLGSLFASGKGYGLCLAAIGDTHALKIGEAITYQVTTNKHGEGWQPRVKGGRNKNLTHTPRKVLLIEELRAELMTKHQMQFLAVNELSEHELMAYGVLRYHLQKIESTP
jgi:hypothetical protein